MLSVQFIGEELNMSKQIEDLKLQTKVLFKVVDKLEQRISTSPKRISKTAKVRCYTNLSFITLKTNEIPKQGRFCMGVTRLK